MEMKLAHLSSLSGGQPKNADEYTHELHSVLALCSLLEIEPADALRELRTQLQDRRDFVAIPYPGWRQRHLDICLKHMERIYGSRLEAREKFEAMKDVFQRHGVRAEDKAAQKTWKDRELDRGRQNTCPYCHITLDVTNAQVDHRIPVGRGGKDTPSNWQLACSECNRGKSDALDTSFALTWGGGSLYRQLVLRGKATISLLERFQILARDRFSCRAARENGHAGPLRLYFRTPPVSGGQALPDNLICLCVAHGASRTAARVERKEELNW